MRFLIIACLFCFISNTWAQDSLQIKAPRIIMQKKLNQVMVFEDVAITLVNVISDSRCPEDVNCVRAGDAKVILEIVEAGKIRKVEQVIIQANFNPENLPLIYKTKTKQFLAVGLMPYPNSSNKIKLEDYILQIEVRK